MKHLTDGERDILDELEADAREDRSRPPFRPWMRRCQRPAQARRWAGMRRKSKKPTRWPLVPSARHKGVRQC